MGLWANPLYHGDFPELVKERVANRSRLEGRNSSRLPEFTEAEKRMVKGTCDFFSINIYASSVVKNTHDDSIESYPTIDGDSGVQTLVTDDVSK